PAQAVDVMLERARQAERGGHPIEILFHLEWAAGQWLLHVPPQEGSASHVRPLEDGADSSYARVLIEVHSHHGMDAYWSETDNRDERSGFRLYGVLGRIFTHPVLRVRVGMHGHFLQVPAAQIFDLPPGLHEALEEEHEEN